MEKIFSRTKLIRHIRLLLLCYSCFFNVLYKLENILRLTIGYALPT